MRDRGATIINLSVSTASRLTPIEDALYNRANLLLIVAAGNDASDLDVSDRFPAALSRQDIGYRGRVVTVAAYGRTGCLSGFSGRGEENVDLVAPGEEIRALGLGGTELTDEGTSQATALVSFTAANLRAIGLDRARAVKERLIASVDLKPQFHGHVRSEGALNIVKALSIFDDSVQLASNSAVPIYGKLQTSLTPENVCPILAGDQRSVLKVSRRVDGGDPNLVRVLLRRNDDRGELRHVYCVPRAEQLILSKTDGALLSFRLSDLIDLVPRM
jgi:subtilisin family serine protease